MIKSHSCCGGYSNDKVPAQDRPEFLKTYEPLSFDICWGHWALGHANHVTSVICSCHIHLITVRLYDFIPTGYADTPWIPALHSNPTLLPCHWLLGRMVWRLGLLHHERFLDQHISDDISALEPLKTVKCILDRQERPSLIGVCWVATCSRSAGLNRLISWSCPSQGFRKNSCSWRKESRLT